MKASTRKNWPGCGLVLALLLCAEAEAQVNSGSTGADGAFNPTTNTVINMADHPDGIYHYTSVNIPTGVTVSFIPNAGNKPVVWLIQGDCVLNGIFISTVMPPTMDKADQRESEVIEVELEAEGAQQKAELVWDWEAGLVRLLHWRAAMPPLQQ